MRLAVKHSGQNIKEYVDFTGGLNTTSVAETIGDNQLAECVNMELNLSNGTLQTCYGTSVWFKAPDGVQIDVLFYDRINNVYLICDNRTKKVYKTCLTDLTGNDKYDCKELGSLSGSMEPSAVHWEDGLLIASGGRLQYWNGIELAEIVTDFNDEKNYYDWSEVGESVDSELWETYAVHEEWKHDTEYTTSDIVYFNGKYYLCEDDHCSIAQSPEKCNGVFVKDGRVWVWYEYRLQCSAVGDERMWTDDTNDDSTSKWIDVGYKEGENNSAYIIGVTTLSSDTVIIKNNGKVYRLAGTFPDWTLLEVARNIDCINSKCYCAVQDSVFILGKSGLFYLQTTANYGDLYPKNVAVNISGLFYELSMEESMMKFIPALNQIWIACNGETVIVYDLNFQAFFQRKFNNHIQDILPVRDTLLLARHDKVTWLMKGCYKDEIFSKEEAWIDWSFKGKTITSFFDFFLRRTRVHYVPLECNSDSAELILAEGKLLIPLPNTKDVDWLIATDETLIVNDERLVLPVNYHYNTKWSTYRNQRLDIAGKGKRPVILMRISAAITEV